MQVGGGGVPGAADDSDFFARGHVGVGPRQAFSKVGVSGAVAPRVLEQNGAAVMAAASQTDHPAVRRGQHGIAAAAGLQKIDPRVQAAVAVAEGRQHPRPFQRKAKMDFEGRIGRAPARHGMKPRPGEGPRAGRQKKDGPGGVKGTG